jgi:hypothetical protein
MAATNKDRNNPCRTKEKITTGVIGCIGCINAYGHAING